MLSFLNGFSFNQIVVKEEDHAKKTFTIPWGSYEYLTMPFGLMNVRSTFHRAINYVFQDIMQKILEIYEDDLLLGSAEPFARFT